MTLQALRAELALSDFHIVGGSAKEQPGENEFRPRSGLPAYPLELPLDWNADPFRDRNWRFQLSAWRMLDPLWRRYSQEPAPSLLLRALDFVRDWHRFHQRMGRETPFTWNDMATGLRAQHLAWMIREGGNVLAAEDMRFLEDAARAHYRRLQEPGFVSMSNHGIFQVHGRRLLEIVLDCLATGDDIAETDKLMMALLDAQFDAFGIHREGAPFYHFFAERRLRKARPHLYPRIAEALQERLARARAATPWFVMPDGRFAAVGDSEGAYPATVVLPKGEERAKATDGVAVFGKAFLESGYACIRSGVRTPPAQAFMLFVSASALGGAAHDHADALGFELYAAGAPLLVDAGKYGYENDRWRRYVVSDRAHNTVGRASRTYMPGDAGRVGSCLDSYRIEENVHLVAGSASRADGFSFSRQFRFEPMASLELHDQVKGLPEGEAAELRFHFHESCRLEPNGAGFDILRDGIWVARLLLPGGTRRARVVRGQEEPILGWRSGNYRKLVPSPSLVIELDAGIRSMATRLEFRQS